MSLSHWHGVFLANNTYGSNSWVMVFNDQGDSEVDLTGLSATSSVGDGTNMGVPQTRMGWN